MDMKRQPFRLSRLAMPNLGVGAGGAIVIAAPAERATLAATMLRIRTSYLKLVLGIQLLSTKC